MDSPDGGAEQEGVPALMLVVGERVGRVAQDDRVDQTAQVRHGLVVVLLRRPESIRDGEGTRNGCSGLVADQAAMVRHGVVVVLLRRTGGFNHKGATTVVAVLICRRSTIRIRGGMTRRRSCFSNDSL